MIMQERHHEDATGAILFDLALSPQVGQAWFAPAYWRSQGTLSMQAGGRGGVAVVGTPAGECVLRHYRRGGLVARLLGDRYVWTGADRTRSFAEFRLLGAIARLGLPGPRALAARYCGRWPNALPRASSTASWRRRSAAWWRVSTAPACGTPTSMRTMCWWPTACFISSISTVAACVARRARGGTPT